MLPAIRSAFWSLSGRLQTDPGSLVIISIAVVLLVVGIVAITWRMQQRLNRETALRQQAETALQEREHHFRAMEDQLSQLSRAVEQSPTSIVITDRNGSIIYVNPKFTEVTGYTREETLGRNPSMLKTQYTGEGVHANLWQTILNGQEWRGEFCNRKKDGSLYWEYASISPILDVHGDITHFVAVKEDITARKQMEEALRSSEELYRHMFEKHAAVKMLIDPATSQIVDANEAAVQFYGYPLETLRQMTIDQINGLSSEEAHAVVQAVAGGAQQYLMLQHRRASGEVRDVEVYSGPIQSGGRTLLYSIIHDITARREAEQRLQRQNEALQALYRISLDLLRRRDAETLFQMIVDTAIGLLDVSYGAIYLLDGDELVIRAFTANQSFLADDRATRDRAHLAWQAIDSRRPAVVNDYRNWEFHRDLYDRLQLTAVVDFPILNDEHCMGVLALGRTVEGYPFDSEQIQVGQLFAQLVALALDNTQLYQVALAELEERRRAEQSLQEANEELRGRLAEIEELQEALREQALRDPLTGLYNRRYLFEALRRESSRAWRGSYPLSIVVLDIDNFKRLNDTYGHAAGDKALQVLAGQLQVLTRTGDVVCRYGGEEFLIVLVNAPSSAAYERAEQWRQTFEVLRFTYEETHLYFTISGGVASFPDDGNMLEDVIRAADQALYRAKANGKNRIERHHSVMREVRVIEGA